MPTKMQAAVVTAFKKPLERQEWDVPTPGPDQILRPRDRRCHRARLVWGARKDIAECLDFAAKGEVKADIELQPLASINTIFERLEQGDVPSRVVLDFTATKSEKAAGQKTDAVRAVPVLA
jgi:D-arabinose 1-dehydrogenase-like Zn-dependent alcohol dehydrogenase